MNFFQLFKTFSKTERRIFLAGLVIFIIAFSFWITRSYERFTVPRPNSGGTYTEGLIGQPSLVNPTITATDVDRDLAELLFAGLLDLADQYEISADQKNWTFNLKEGRVWSDGEPITSDDVIFTLELMKDSDARSPLTSTWQGVVAERLSERQFRLTLKTPYAFFLDNLKSLKIIPRHVFEVIPPANLRLSEFNLEPIASGPFIFNSLKRRRDGFITYYNLIRNENFAGQKPLLKEFWFRFFSNKEDLLDAFNQREIDGFGGLEFKDLKDIRVGHRILKIALPSYYAVFFNPALNAQLKDRDIREALTLATDKNRIVHEVFSDDALIIHGPIVPTISGYAPNIYKNEETSFDKASAILENNGWRRDEDGIRFKTIDRKKMRLEFEIIVPQVEFLLKTVEIIKADWEKIGVRLNPVVLRPSEITGDIIKTRNYQILIFGTIIKNNPDVFSFWHSSERFYPGANLSLFANKTIDGLLESIKIELDQEKRQISIAKIQEIIHKERPAIFLFSPLYIYVTSKKLGGFETDFIASRPNRFENVSEWHVKISRL